jgi:hypothetical protein
VNEKDSAPRWSDRSARQIALGGKTSGLSSGVDWGAVLEAGQELK